MRLVWVVIPLVFLGIIGMQESFASEPCDLYPQIYWNSYDDIYTGKVVSVTNQTEDVRIDFELERLLKGNPPQSWHTNVPFGSTPDHYQIKGADHYTIGSEIFYIENYNGNGPIDGGGYCGIGVSKASSPIFQLFFEYYEELYGKPSPKYIENNNQESFAEEQYKSGFTAENVTSKISSGQTIEEKLASVPICEDSSKKFPNSVLTSEQKTIKSFYQSDLVVTGQIVNKTAYSFNEKTWDILHIQVEDIINPNPNFSSNVEHPIILISSKCWSYSGILQNDWSFDVEGDVFLYLNRIHDVRFTILNPTEDTSVNSNILSIPSPLVQNKAISNGMWHDSWNNVYCKPSLVPITKPNAEFACVTSHTAEKLIQRGW